MVEGLVISSTKVHMRRYFSFALTLLFATLIIPLRCSCKSGNAHYWDMVSVMPFDHNKDIANKKMLDFFKEVNAYVDNANYPDKHRTGNPAFVKYNPALQNMHFANHRIWFHWGFNRDPKRFNPLQRVVLKNIIDGGLAEENEYLFWGELRDEIKRRNKILMSKWAKLSGYGGLNSLSHIKREQSNAFVTLLVCVHLLGDHTTTETAVIISRENLYADIEDAIDKIAGKQYDKNREAAISLKNKLKRVKGTPQLYIEKLSKEFTPFLYSLKGETYNYKKHFESQGYKLK